MRGFGDYLIGACDSVIVGWWAWLSQLEGSKCSEQTCYGCTIMRSSPVGAWL